MDNYVTARQSGPVRVELYAERGKVIAKAGRDCVSADVHAADPQQALTVVSDKDGVLIVEVEGVPSARSVGGKRGGGVVNSVVASQVGTVMQIGGTLHGGLTIGDGGISFGPDAYVTPSVSEETAGLVEVRLPLGCTLVVYTEHADITAAASDFILIKVKPGQSWPQR